MRAATIFALSAATVADSSSRSAREARRPRPRATRSAPRAPGRSLSPHRRNYHLVRVVSSTLGYAGLNRSPRPTRSHRGPTALPLNGITKYVHADRKGRRAEEGHLVATGRPVTGQVLRVHLRPSCQGVSRVAPVEDQDAHATRAWRHTCAGGGPATRSGRPGPIATPPAPTCPETGPVWQSCSTRGRAPVSYGSCFPPGRALRPDILGSRHPIGSRRRGVDGRVDDGCRRGDGRSNPAGGWPAAAPRPSTRPTPGARPCRGAWP